MTLYRLVKKNGEVIMTTNSVMQMIGEILIRKADDEHHLVEIVQSESWRVIKTESVITFLERFQFFP